MRTILLTTVFTTAFLLSVFFLVFCMHDQPVEHPTQNNKLYEGCVYQQSHGQTIRTCG